MSAHMRSVCLFFMMGMFFQPVLTHGNEAIQFKQGAMTISTTLYGGFLIDRDGFMWIGTTGLGVYRYDGYELKNFATSIQGSMISSIVEDQDGVVWIASFSHGLTSYNKDTGLFTEYTHDPDNANSLSSNNMSFSPQKLFVDTSKGWDTEWYDSGSNPLGRYSGLAGGQYTLRLKGSNNDRVWNDTGVSVTVIVTPPFWETGLTRCA
ncbi:MAG: hypothetical protein GY801_12045 [bacterium]|nr:hypothetical protein [bacterium]